MYITDIRVNDGHKSSLTFFREYPSLKHHILFYSNGLATCIWHSFPDISHNKINNGLKLAILNLIDETTKGCVCVQYQRHS